MQLQKHKLVLILLIILIGACTKSGTPPEDIKPELPGKPEGILPANAETCSDFEEVIGAADKAAILFSWSPSENTTNYLLRVFASETEVSSSTVSTTEAKLTLEKGKSYTWSITAKNGTGEAISNTLSFTTPGRVIGNFAPYAAEINTEYNSTSSELSISWSGSDEDGDILTYDASVKDGGGNDILNQTNLSESILNPISVTLGETYTIRITSRDGSSNFSISAFTVKVGD